MESTPLVLAHSHARNASAETHKANPVAASEEHDLAAGEFANAASITTDAEALRTLKLLEQHHQKLAELLKFRPQDAQPTPAISPSSSLQEEPSPAPALPTPKTLESSPRHISQHTSPLLQTPHRDLTSSIASNLASARGIPSHRQRRINQTPTALSPQLAEGKLVSLQARSRLSAQDNKAEEPSGDAPFPFPRPSALSPTRAQIQPPDITLTSPARLPSSQIPTPVDDSFSRFYSTFETLLSALSAPLAFAGLPLTPTDPAPTTTPTPSSEKKHQPPSPSTLDPDITRLFSRAALRAVRSEHNLPPTSESFYVVPTTGGTMSYASMLSHTQKKSSHLSSVDEDELFVDASETPHPDNNTHQHSNALSARQQELRRRRGGGKPGSGKTMEELTVENETLKAVAIDLADRLRAFEMGAQRSSMALHMSMRAMHSPTASAALGRGGRDGEGKGEGRIARDGEGRGGKDAEPKPGKEMEQEAQIQELEEEVRGTRKEMKRLARENQKLQGVVDRYRERWEILKDGARERMKGDGREGWEGRG